MLGVLFAIECISKLHMVSITGLFLKVACGVSL